MPTLLPPSVRTIDKSANRHAVSFAFDWDGETTSLIAVAGIQEIGASFTVSTVGLSTASLPAMRSMRFSQSFFSSDDPALNDGSLFIITPASGDVTRISPLLLPPTTYDRQFPVVTGAIPIVSAIDAPVQFVKQSVQDGSPTGFVAGILTVTLYDFDIAPFMQSGFSNQE